MTNEEIIEMAKQAGFERLGVYAQFGDDWVSFTEDLETFAKLVSEKAVEESNHIIFKSCINQPHWKRLAMRYLKRNAPMLHHQAVTEFNEHPDGRGKNEV